MTKSDERYGPLMSTIGELRQYLGSGRTLSSSQARNMYNCLLHGDNAEHFEEWARSESKSTCEVAEKMHNYRSMVRAYMRERGSWFVEKALGLRDQWKYGNAGGPTFSDLLIKEEKKLIRQSGDSDLKMSNDMTNLACEHIQQSATRSNATFNVMGSGDHSCDIGHKR